MMKTHRSTDHSNPESLSYKKVMGAVKGIEENMVETTKIEEYTAFVLSVASAKDTSQRIQQGIIGATTETGELLDALKKHMFQGRPIDPVNIKEECGDLWFYMTEIMAAINTTIFEVMEINVAKLKQRYPAGFDTQKSVDRDINKEREILEETRLKYSCESCADTVCGYAGQEDNACERFKDNRNYPIEPTAHMKVHVRTPMDVDRDVEDIIERQRKLADDIVQEELAESAAKKACCGNCAERLTLKGCSRYIKTHDEGCCIDHKFM